VESFNGKLRDELLNGEIFYTLAEAKIVIEQWRRHYNTVRPHSSLGYEPPAPEVVSWPASSPLVERPMLNQHPDRTTQWGPVIDCTADANDLCFHILSHPWPCHQTGMGNGTYADPVMSRPWNARREQALIWINARNSISIEYFWCRIFASI